MSTMALPITPSSATTQPAQRRAVLPLLWISSLIAFLDPRASRYWLRATMLQAALVAACNTALAFVWLFAVAELAEIWLNPMSFRQFGNARMNPVAYSNASHIVRAEISAQWDGAARLDRVAVVGGIACFIILAYLGTFFVLLPFGARPGSNKACFKHVGRTVFLGTGLVHFWGIAFCAVFFYLCGFHYQLPVDDQIRLTAWSLLAIGVLIVWQMPVLVHAVRREYRTPAEHPVPHDPWCENCGYNLTGIDLSGRCPECGLPVQESVGETTRAITPWETQPSLRNTQAVTNQLKAIILRPRSLFFSMPTLTGQRAAQRWLLWSLLALFTTALFIVPVMYVVLDGSLNWVLVWGTLVMGIMWALFGLMMVGIETAGVATVSRMRGHPGGGVPLAAAAKVTCYSSILMLPWVVLGGIQLVTYIYLQASPHRLIDLVHGSVRGEQFVLAASLALAHIGGLIWYELTVYRGIRAVQYANK